VNTISSANSSVKLRVSDVVYEVVFDVATMTGEAIETIEDHIGGEPFMGWLGRLAESFTRGTGVRELRARDIIALVFLARVRLEPGLLWTDVSRSIAPYTLTVADDDEDSAAAPAATSPVAAALDAKAT